MKQYEALLEDENDIFGGTPKSKLWDMLQTAHEDISKEIIDEIITSYACMEDIIKQTIGEEEINKYIKNYHLENEEKIEDVKKAFIWNLLEI